MQTTNLYYPPGLEDTTELFQNEPYYEQQVRVTQCAFLWSAYTNQYATCRVKEDVLYIIIQEKIIFTCPVHETSFTTEKAVTAKLYHKQSAVLWMTFLSATDFALFQKFVKRSKALLEGSYSPSDEVPKLQPTHAIVSTWNKKIILEWLYFVTPFHDAKFGHFCSRFDACGTADALEKAITNCAAGNKIESACKKYILQEWNILKHNGTSYT